MTNYNFESVNFPGFFIRHSNFTGELTRRGGPVKDFAFSLVKRGNGAVAFRSANFPDRYLRHRDVRVYLEGPSGPHDDLFRRIRASRWSVALLIGRRSRSGLSTTPTGISVIATSTSGWSLRPLRTMSSSGRTRRSAVNSRPYRSTEGWDSPLDDRDRAPM